MGKSYYRGLLPFIFVFTLVLGLTAQAEQAPKPAPAGDVLKFTATSSDSRSSTKYWYWTISAEAYTFQSGDYLEYDVFLANDQAGLGAVEVFTNDETWFRDQEDWKDQNERRGHPGTDIARYGYGMWYHRKMRVPAGMIGRTSLDFALAVEFASQSKTYVAYYDNITITNDGKTVLTVYADGQPSVSQSRGGVDYTCQVDVVPVEDAKI